MQLPLMDRASNIEILQLTALHTKYDNFVSTQFDHSYTQSSTTQILLYNFASPSWLLVNYVGLGS